MGHKQLSGVFAAAVTPINHNFDFERPDLPLLLEFLAERGCDGALLLGTTGEGPSFSPRERLDIWKTGLKIRETYPSFKLLAGTGTPSLDETIELTRAAFDLGFDGAVVLPPYYFRSASEDGLFRWFDRILAAAVPAGAPLLGYDFPRMTGFQFSIPLLSRLLEAHPGRFAGLKDSTGDLSRARELGSVFGDDLLIFNGTDRIFSEALKSGAAGCITALANLISPSLREVWNAHHASSSAPAAEGDLIGSRSVLEKFPPAPPLIKHLMAEIFNLPAWEVKPPLLKMQPATAQRALTAWKTRGQIAG